MTSKTFKELLSASSLGPIYPKCAQCDARPRRRSRCRLCARPLCAECRDPASLGTYCKDKSACKWARGKT